MLIQQHYRTLVNYREQPISDQRVQKYIELAADDEDFLGFHTFSNIQFQQAITYLYGKLSLLLLPILTQYTIASFTRLLKLTFPTQYKAIIFLLNKHSCTKRFEINLFLWDCYALYLFIILMRINNSKNFVWWDMCNVASHYGHGGSNLSVLLGISVSQTSLI